MADRELNGNKSMKPAPAESMTKAAPAENTAKVVAPAENTAAQPEKGTVAPAKKVAKSAAPAEAAPALANASASAKAAEPAAFAKAPATNTVKTTAPAAQTSAPSAFPQNLTVNASPHVKSAAATSKIMQDVLVALVPCVLAAVFLYGAYALAILVASVASAVAGEAAFQAVRKRPLTLSDGSAMVTGLILGLNLPAAVPLYVPLIGGAFATVLVKMVFGGLGSNFANPAATARIFLMLAYTSVMTRFPLPNRTLSGIFSAGYDGVTSATPLGGASASMKELLWGLIPGAMGETCKVAVLMGFVYLLQRKVISWRIPVTYVVTFAFLTFLTVKSGEKTLTAVLSGGLLFGATFMATDYATSPKTDAGRMLFGMLLGVFTFLIRNFTAYNEGVAFSILLCNVLCPVIDDRVLPVRFGSGKKPVLEISLYAIFAAMAAATVVLSAVFRG